MELKLNSSFIKKTHWKMNTIFFDKVEEHVEIIWQGKRKENSFFGKMRKMIKFYNIYIYIYIY
jgi:hypothetical protein